MYYIKPFLQTGQGWGAFWGRWKLRNESFFCSFLCVLFSSFFHYFGHNFNKSIVLIHFSIVEFAVESEFAINLSLGSLKNS